MRPTPINLSIFDQPLQDLLKAAGFASNVVENPANSVRYILDHSLNRDTQLLTVKGGMCNKIAKGCLAHLERKYGNSNYAVRQQQEGPLRAGLCTFAAGGGVFEAAPDEFYVSEGYSDAQAMLYWLADQAIIMPIIVQGKTARFHEWTANIHPSMSPAFRREHFTTLIHLMDAMERLTVLGPAIKVAQGLYNGLDLLTGEDHAPDMHMWYVGQSMATTRNLLQVPGLLAESNLLATAWHMVNVYHQRQALLNRKAG